MVNIVECQAAKEPDLSLKSTCKVTRTADVGFNDDMQSIVSAAPPKNQLLQTEGQITFD